MSIPAGILEALTAVTGKTFKESDFFEGDGDDKKPKQGIKKLILDPYKTKHEALDKVSEEKLEKAKQSGRKEIYDKIEAEAKDKNVEIKFTETGIQPIFDAAVEVAKTIKVDPKEVKNSEEYKALQTKYKESVAEGKRKDAAHAQERIHDSLYGGFNDILKDESLKFIVPKSETVKKNLTKAYKSEIISPKYTNSKGTFDVKWVKNEDGDTIPVDKDGDHLYDDNGNIVTAYQVKSLVAKNYFETAVASPRESAGAGDRGRGGAGASGFSHTVKYKQGGDDKSFEFPSEVKDKASANKWVSENAMGQSVEWIDAAQSEVAKFDN